MDQLRVGEEVLVADPQTGVVSFSPVMWFQKAVRNVTGEVLRIRLADGTTVSTTETHNTFVRLQENGNTEELLAGNVRVGMWMLVVAEANQHMVRAVQVVEVRRDWDTGFYAPITAAGTVVVDKVLMSVFANYRLEHKRVLMKPLIWLYQLVGIPGAGELPQETAQHWYAKAAGLFMNTVFGPEFGRLPRLGADSGK